MKKVVFKIRFSKNEVLWSGAYKNGIDKPRQMVWLQVSIKTLEVYFEVSMFLITTSGRK